MQRPAISAQRPETIKCPVIRRIGTKRDGFCRRPQYQSSNAQSLSQSKFSLLGWLPKLDRIAIRIFKPRKGSHGGICLALFDYHALTLKMAEDFSHVFHCVINLTRSRFIL